MKWTEFNTTLKKDKKKDKDKDKNKIEKRIIKIKDNTFMIETKIDEKTRRFDKVDIDLKELNELRKQKYVE